MGKLEGKVAVITAATSGMALATAKLFVQEVRCIHYRPPQGRFRGSGGNDWRECNGRAR